MTDSELLKMIKGGLEFIPHMRYDIPEDDYKFMDEVYFPIKKAFLDNDQEIITFLENATVEQRLYCSTAIEAAMKELNENGLITESTNGEYDHRIELAKQISKELSQWMEEDQDPFEDND